MNNSLPLWVADKNFRFVFLNRRMREQFGISFDQGMGGFSISDLAPQGALSSTASGTGLQAAALRLRHTDGRYRPTISYYRALRVNGAHYGFVGCTVPQNRCSGDIYPAPILDRPANRKLRLSIDLVGVVIDLISADIRSLGPLVNLRQAEDCVDIEAYRDELTELYSLQLAGEIFRPANGFVESIPAYGDFNLGLVSELHAIEAIHAIFFTKPFFTGRSAADASPMDVRFWCEKYGLAYGDIDSTPRSPVEKMLAHGVDVHLDDNPEDWVQALFAGIPCFLMDRPWNRWIRSPLRVYSVEAMLQEVGVETNRTYSDYDACMMAKAS